MNKWFINQNSYIRGPFSNEDVKQFINSHSNDLAQIYIWARGYSEWIRGDRWNDQKTADQYKTAPMMAHIPKTKEAASNNPVPLTQNKSSSSQDLLKNVAQHSVEKYRVQYNFVAQPDMNLDELMQFTARASDVSKIAVFDKKTQEWKEIYSLSEVVAKLGITRRKGPRVPILAQFTGTKAFDKNQMTQKVITISVGGMGITDNFDLKLGEIIKGQLTSPHFYTPITVEAEVTYSGLDGYVGMKFTHINDEGKSLITDYIKKFMKDQPE